MRNVFSSQTLWFSFSKFPVILEVSVLPDARCAGWLMSCSIHLIPCSICCPVAQDRDDDDEDWAEETTEEAQRRRMEEISDHAKNLTLSDDLEKPLEERVNLFYSFVKVSVGSENSTIMGSV